MSPSDPVLAPTHFFQNGFLDHLGNHSGLGRDSPGDHFVDSGALPGATSAELDGAREVAGYFGAGAGV